MPPAAPALQFVSPRISMRPDALISLPVRRWSCTRLMPRKSVLVDAATINGAKLEGAHKLGCMPNRLVVVEVEPRLAGNGSA